jgi:DNA invertase Pin-like site-specific DNA recombinase
MDNNLKILGYKRISVDEEIGKENTSIENQHRIIEDYVQRAFPDAALDFAEDRDRSGYTFEQREGYMKVRPLLMDGTYDVLIVKDLSRFSRRNSKGLVELEDLRDAGLRIIAIDDNIDYPTCDDWMAIQFRFLMNETPITDTSKKVNSVVQRRQSDGKWICAVPYGYVMTDSKKMVFQIDETSAEVVREVFKLYNSGWGYKKIANYLTDKRIPTPRMVEKLRKEANGEENKIKAGTQWSIITVSEILQNDFYIGTLRQRKYKRKKSMATMSSLMKVSILSLRKITNRLSSIVCLQ